MGFLSFSEQNGTRAIIIAAGMLLSFAYFFKGNSGDSNQNARYDLTRAIVEEHTLRIDSYHQNTASKALYNQHYYSDKAPGLSLTAVPVWAAAHEAAALADVPGRESSEGKVFRLKTYFSTLAVVGLPTALAAACIYSLALALGASPTGAAFGAITFGIGTPMWTYAILFRSHATVAALLLFAFVAALAVRNAHSPRRAFFLGVAIALPAGWATLTEYPAAPAAAVLAILGLVHAKQSKSSVSHLAGGIAVAGLFCAAVLMSYQYLAFGSPFHVSYSYTTYDVAPPSPEMGNGFFGLSYPRMKVLWEVLFGRYRGLFQLAPVLVVAPLGFVLLWRRRPEWHASILAIAALVGYYVVFNASYRYWDGGYSTGPRHIAPLLPFLCFALSLLWTWSRPIYRLAMSILALYGSFIALMAVCTDPMPGTDVKSPVQELFWPAFRSGNLATSNVGKILGLEGLTKLLPLLLIWVLLLGIWFVWERKFDRRGN